MGAGPSQPRYDSNYGGNRRRQPFAGQGQGLGYGQQPGVYLQQQQLGMMQQPGMLLPNMYPMVMTPMMQLSGQPVNEQMQEAIQQAQQYARAQAGVLPQPAPSGPEPMPMPQPQVPFTQTQFPAQPLSQAPQPQPEVPIRFSPVPPETQAQYPRAMSRAPTYMSSSSSSDDDHRQNRLPDPPRDIGNIEDYLGGTSMAHALPLPPAPRSNSPLKNPLPSPPKDVYRKKKYRPLLQTPYADVIGTPVYPEDWFSEEEGKIGIGRALSKLNPFKRRGYGSSYGHKRHATLPSRPQFVQQELGSGESESSSASASAYEDKSSNWPSGPGHFLRRRRRNSSEVAPPAAPEMDFQPPIVQPTPRRQPPPIVAQPSPSPQPQPAVPLDASELPPGFMPATPFGGGPSPNPGLASQPQPNMPFSPENAPIFPGQPITPAALSRSMPTPRLPMSPVPVGQHGSTHPLSTPDESQPMPGQPLSPVPSQFSRAPGTPYVQPGAPASPSPSPYRAGFTPGPNPARALSPDDTPSVRPRRYPATPGPPHAMEMPEPVIPLSPNASVPRRYPATPGPRSASMPESSLPLSPRVIPPSPFAPHLVAGEGPPGASPRPTVLGMPTPRMGSVSGVAPPLRFDQYTPDYCNLCHVTAADVAYRGRVYPTAAHLFEAFKFLGYRDDLAERVRRTRDFHELAPLIDELDPFVRPDWEYMIVDRMEEALYCKVIQNQDLVDLLLNTGVANIIFDDKEDPLWGSGQYNEGSNELGKALMRIRERVRQKELQEQGY